MNKKITLATYVIIIAYCLLFQKTNAQWANYAVGFSGNTFNQPDYINFTNVESFGLGDFNLLGTPAYPLSALHINTNLFAFTPSYNAGEVFRTDCPQEKSTFWRMNRNAVEYGMLYHLNPTDDSQYFNGAGPDLGIHFYMQASNTSDDGKHAGDLPILI